MRKYYRARPNGPAYPSNSEPPFHKVTHRHDKSIPGCTLAPREGTYIAMTQEQAQAICAMRANCYEADVVAYINGDLPKEQIFRTFEMPIHGAYGERL